MATVKRAEEVLSSFLSYLGLKNFKANFIKEDFSRFMIISIETRVDPNVIDTEIKLMEHLSEGLDESEYTKHIHRKYENEICELKAANKLLQETVKLQSEIIKKIEEKYL